MIYAAAAAAVVAQGGGVRAVVPDVVAAVLVEIGAPVPADASVNADGGAALDAVVVEGVGVDVLVLKGPAIELTARRAVLMISTHSWFKERLERSSRPGESY